jgi:hypothetical protein
MLIDCQFSAIPLCLENTRCHGPSWRLGRLIFCQNRWRPSRSQKGRRKGGTFLIREQSLLSIPFDRNAGQNLEALGREADALPPGADRFNESWSEQG